MNPKIALACGLSLLASLPSWVSIAYGRTACTPVVYAFRHAEDSKEKAPEFDCLPGSSVKCTTVLLPDGTIHADLYLEMITNLETKDNFCPIKAVYAVNSINPDGFGGTTNPFFTGKPLSDAVRGLDPIVEIGGKRIDQKLTVVKPAKLHEALVEVMAKGDSAALFWTSEGLHDLGLALGSDVIPVKTDTTSPPRNAAYIFKFNGSEAFVPPAKATEYVQCFNYAKDGDTAHNFTNRFYCGDGTNGNLSVSPTDFDKLHGRICNREAIDFKKTNPPAGYYGYCESPPSGSPP